mgnify:CR=1 FL=1
MNRLGVWIKRSNNQSNRHSRPYQDNTIPFYQNPSRTVGNFNTSLNNAFDRLSTESEKLEILKLLHNSIEKRKKKQQHITHNPDEHNAYITVLENAKFHLINRLLNPV